MTRDFFSEHLVRGRRPHYCQHCRQTILMGDPHVHVSSCSSGTFHSHRSHVACHEAATGKPFQQGASKISQPGATPGAATNQREEALA